jgi:uncharacterized UBP type Zn finger protein
MTQNPSSIDDMLNNMVAQDIQESKAQGPCAHFKNGVRITRILHNFPPKKKVCKECEKDSHRSKNQPTSPKASNPPSSLWICLYCAMCHCGRYDKGHAQIHFEQNQQYHSIVFNMETCMIWCYLCDDELIPSDSMPFLQDVKFKLERALGKTADAASSMNQIEPFSGSALPFTDKTSIPGLVNLGNTCFFNSLMQTFIHSKLLLPQTLDLKTRWEFPMSAGT